MGKGRDAIRCPKCNRFGTKDLGGYCKACYEEPVIQEEKITPCSRCGEPATRVNDEYEGCVPYDLCDSCYIDRFGFLPESDFPEGSAPACIQCGATALKIADNNQPYCLRHYRDRMIPPIDPIRDEFVADFAVSDQPFWDDKFKIVKNEFDVERKWQE